MYRESGGSAKARRADGSAGARRTVRAVLEIVGKVGSLDGGEVWDVRVGLRDER